MTISKEQFIRGFVSDQSLEECREHLVHILVTHLNKDLTAIEAVLVRELVDLGIQMVRSAPKLEGAKE